MEAAGKCNLVKAGSIEFRVSPNVGQKTGLNKVVVGTFEMGTDSSRFRSELKPPHLPLKSACPHLDQRQKIVYRANTRAEFPPFARHHKFLESEMDAKER